MAHTYTHLKYHVIFSTASRKPLVNNDFAPHLYAYMGGIIRELGGIAHTVNGMPDHVHLLIGLPADLPISKAVQTLKANATRWANTEGRQTGFAWQIGYGAFTISASGQSKIQSYIENQTAHHEKFTFQEELITLLKKHKINYDPRFVFD